MTRPYKLSPDKISGDTVRALEELLADARAGRLTGLAFVGIYSRGRRYIVNTAGQARVDPVTTRGMVGSLDDSLHATVAHHH